MLVILSQFPNLLNYVLLELSGIYDAAFLLATVTFSVVKNIAVLVERCG